MTWFRRLSLRGRLVLIGTTGLALGLAAGGAVLVAVLHVVQVRALDESARRTAEDVAGLVDVGRLGDPVPTAGTQVVQVLDGQSRIRAASMGADRLVALLRPAELDAARHGAVVRVDGARVGQDGPLRVVAVDAGPADDRRTVVVAAPARDLEASVRLLRWGLVLVYPVLLAALAVLAWRVVGWTLRPVEALRAGAEEIKAVPPFLAEGPQLLGHFLDVLVGELLVVRHESSLMPHRRLSHTARCDERGNW